MADYENDLTQEFDLHHRPTDRRLIESLDQNGGLLWVSSAAATTPLDLSWVRSRWHNLHLLKFESIGAAARELEAKAARWISHSFSAHRRSQLLQEKLRSYPKIWRDFRQSLDPSETWGGYVLLDEQHLVYSLDIDPRLPLEGPRFQEDKTAPSRAYLKLWEAFHRFGDMPNSSAKCFELGASPGGWTTVLRSLDAEVWATDRAELAANLMKDPKVHFQKGDGFQWNPGKLPPMDWVFSDVICYPERLWDWVQPWLALPQPPKMLCTVKCQGETDFKTLQKFAAVPGARLVHLFQNKHELTWFYQPPG